MTGATERVRSALEVVYSDREVRAARDKLRDLEGQKHRWQEECGRLQIIVEGLDPSGVDDAGLSEFARAAHRTHRGRFEKAQHDLSRVKREMDELREFLAAAERWRRSYRD